MPTAERNKEMKPAVCSKHGWLCSVPKGSEVVCSCGEKITLLENGRVKHNGYYRKER